VLLGNIPFLLAAVALVILILALLYAAQRYQWRTAVETSVSLDNFRTPFVAGVSVLAIAIPLVANLAFKVAKTTENRWIVALLLMALAFALAALWIGTVFVYKFSLETEGDQLQISRELAPWITVQYAATILFITFFFIGLIVYIMSIFARSDSTPPSQGAQPSTSATPPSQGSQRLTSTKPLPVPGSDKSEILEAWGKPNDQGKTWLTYRTANSTVVFCLEDLEDIALVDKVIVAEAKEDPNAVRTDCTSYR
jgi:hypothetical protein